VSDMDLSWSSSHSLEPRPGDLSRDSAPVKRGVKRGVAFRRDHLVGFETGAPAAEAGTRPAGFASRPRRDRASALLACREFRSGALGELLAGLLAANPARLF